MSGTSTTPLACDIDHLWGNDIGVTPSGDINLVSGSYRTIERVIRRLMTTPTTQQGSAYPWQPTYGVGLGARVGGVLDIRGLQADVMSQILMEPSVSRTPLPVITVNQITATGVTTIGIVYTDNSGTQQNFSFNLAATAPLLLSDTGRAYASDLGSVIHG
jgi:hypothetical protein